MKKVLLPIFILTWTMVLSGLWAFQPGVTTPSALEYVFVGVLIIFFLVGIYLAYKRTKRKSQGFPYEDELSRKVTRSAAAVSYFLSLFLWLTLIYIQTHSSIDINLMLIIGMTGMSAFFIISWFIINKTGVENEK